MEKKVKIALCVVTIILITLIAFVGVYTKNDINYTNKLPDYELARDLDKKRVTSFEIKEGTEDSKKTEENYKMVKKVLDGRLDDMRIKDCLVRVDETNGNVIIELPEDLETDKTLQFVNGKGDFSITDSEDRYSFIR